jgi:S1-C subfamily serine protease
MVIAAVVFLFAGALAERTTGLIGAPAAAAATTSNVPSAGTGASTTSTAASASLASTVNAAIRQAFATANPSVVYVVSQGVGSGSGVIYDSSGDIVTNDHVITGASSLRVTLSNGKNYTAHVVGTDSADDLAVIKINATGLTPAHFAAAGSYQPGDTVLAIGSPVGLQDSVSSGLISGLNRVEQEPSGAYIPNAIQTSAPINPGNSGGALVALDGTVVGIPTLVQSNASDGTPAQAIGFAIPSSRVTFVANQIIATGKVANTGRAYLGVSATDASNAGSGPFGAGVSNVSGALIQQVGSGSPASKAGLQAGEVITAFNGQPITDEQSLLTALAGTQAGQTISLRVKENGNTVNVSVQLGQLPAN